MNTTTSTEEIYEIGFSESTRAGIELLANDPGLNILRAQIDVVAQDLADTSERIDAMEHPAPITLTTEQLLIVGGPVALQAATAAAREIVGCLRCE